MRAIPFNVYQYLRLIFIQLNSDLDGIDESDASKFLQIFRLTHENVINKNDLQLMLNLRLCNRECRFLIGHKQKYLRLAKCHGCLKFWTRY